MAAKIDLSSQVFNEKGIFSSVLTIAAHFISFKNFRLFYSFENVNIIFSSHSFIHFIISFRGPNFLNTSNFERG